MGAPICDVFKFFFTAICLQNEHICNSSRYERVAPGGKRDPLSAAKSQSAASARLTYVPNAPRTRRAAQKPCLSPCTPVLLCPRLHALRCACAQGWARRRAVHRWRAMVVKGVMLKSCC